MIFVLYGITVINNLKSELVVKSVQIDQLTEDINNINDDIGNINKNLNGNYDIDGLRTRLAILEKLMEVLLEHK